MHTIMTILSDFLHGLKTLSIAYGITADTQIVCLLFLDPSSSQGQLTQTLYTFSFTRTICTPKLALLPKR